ncbi:T9SS type A sorting domain-containing protein [Brumimicrobium glaciale]|uniref:T9SS type A sorting domain-containing protein n=1 Tax=Brumimicrobium glaciale TaxID=200475 RepID=A0A4Q4KPQ8_9FLAO|nr:LamG-like jellyroll fold domain-containing protein [Brumimicrobium glaciale]RYM35518.1 T9SS type A sorting domain-containing protein [Brumimicrobium glaciale]
MKNRLLKLITVLALLITSQFSFGQNPGDTTVVQGFNFNSMVRDTQIVFPTFNGNEVERIWMKYTMRCKDGLVSPGISGQTNKGCGEWDYSCNTYITDSTRLDSIKAEINKYIVYPSASSDNNYSTIPTYNIYATEHYDLQITATANEMNAAVTSGGTQLSSALAHTKQGGKSFVLLTTAQLNAAGLTIGDIDALSLFSNGSTNTLNHLAIRMKEITASNLDDAPYSDLINGTEVYHGDLTLTNGQNKIPFYQPFNWTGGNILVEIVSSSNNGSTPIALSATDIGAAQSLTNIENQYARFFPGNYILAPGYLGVSGTTNRTIEGWIKTEGTEVDVVSWGESLPGKRFTIKVNNDGRIKLEVHDGSVTGNQVVNDGEWHHFAVSMSGISLSGTKIYIDGALVNSIDLNNIIVNTSAFNEVEISRGDWNNYFVGEMDDIRIWDTDLSPATIQNYMHSRIDANHPNYSNLQLNYAFDGATNIIDDLSPNNNDGEMIGGAAFGKRSTSQHNFDFTKSSVIPDITFHQADYTLTIVNTQENDSIMKESYIVAQNILDPANGSYSSDITTTYLNYYPKSHSLYDINGLFINENLSSNAMLLTNTVVNYYFRSPSSLELLSLVTPYGVNLDLGMEGVAWYFDVTDFYPILQGNRGLKMTRGGQWQEDIDIQFLFVHGTPAREVMDMRQIWRVDHVNYSDLNANKYYEPRTVDLLPNTTTAKIRSAVTGHGQQGEFTPRQHSLNINNGQQNLQWQVWMKCAENPIYPQGGTWIYDRAGWCPGMPTQMEEWDVTNYINNNQIDVDYGVASATGDSRYIVNHQIISYGPTNFATDARIVTVQAPNDQISFGRTNPMCSDPLVTVQNSGSGNITSLSIEYSINGGSTETFDWTGSLAFMEEEDIVLPSTTALWSSLSQSANNKFEAKIVSVNGGADEYALNNKYKSTFTSTDIVVPEFVLEIKTNTKATQNNYRIEDIAGNIIMERTSLSNNTTYNDTLSLTPGCYRFVIEDSGENGIDFWANNEGAGLMKIKTLDGSQIKRFEGDFGGSYIYEFSVTGEVSVTNQTMYAPSFTVSPIPSNDVINIETKGSQEGTYAIFNAQGQTMKNGTIKELRDNPTISIRNWDTAVYFIHFNTNENTTVQKFIKN